MFLHQDENTQPFGKLSLGPEQAFWEQNLSERKYLQGQIGDKQSVSRVNHAFKVSDRFSEYKPPLPPILRPVAAGHGQDCPQVPSGKLGEVPSCAPHVCQMQHNSPKKETEGKDQYLPKKERLKTYRIIILMPQ